MALMDDVHIEVSAGNGGNGGVARKQIYGSKKTSPDGGNGGNGGNVYFKADNNVSDLSLFMFKKKIKGNDGVNGRNKDLDGANGEDLTVLVPFGTTITDEDNGSQVELITDNPLLVAKGGTGGMGNHDYKPELDNFVYRPSEGGMGEIRKLHLVLNLIADIGLVGMPNAGKSSLLKALTNAVPKVGNYAFTTLEPNLGALGKIILADIPGIIGGASSGKGLGIKFLKHIKKTKMLLHCIDSTEIDLLKTYEIVRQEFGEFDKSLLEKKEIILLTKIDLISGSDVEQKIKKLKKLGKEVLPVSIYDDKSLKTLAATIKNVSV